MPAVISVESTQPEPVAASEIKKTVVSYPLSRNFIDFNRLNLQHHLYKDVFGYSLSPKIPRKKSLKVADIATGTAVWLLDLPSQLDPDTEAELVGLDVDISQVGPKAWLPENLSIREWSVFDDVPEDLVGTFDIVNVRLISFVIKEDPRPVLRNLLKLLKPGGHLQWAEIDLTSRYIETTGPDVPTKALEAVRSFITLKGTLLLPTWPKDLEEIFQTEGLEDIEADWKIGKPHTMLAFHWCNFHIPIMIADTVRQSNSEMAAQMDALIQEAIEEAHKGAMLIEKRMIVTGRKPLA
ncbi:hypothetical protein GGS21DRAFT_306761 [Xylaria nigripes]|nr:hypothetical protein GGS21DRAFT_306761 [Xylaria nigripes]